MKSRSFQSKFFVDPYIQDLTLKQKWIYCYYLFNERVNWLGCYEVSDRTALYEMDSNISQRDLDTAKDIFKNDNKIFFIKTYIILKNSEKYENHLHNKQLMGTALKQFLELPDTIKAAFLSFKPKEVVEAYKSTFSSFDYDVDSSLPSSLLVGYGVDEDIRSKKKEVRSKKKEIRKIDYSKFTDLTESVLQEIADNYGVPLEFVEEKKMDMEIWMGKKPSNKYKDYRMALMKWVRDDMRKLTTKDYRGGVVDVRGL